MAEPHQGHTHAAAFPAPPPFFKHFTAENLSRLKDIQRPNTQSVGDGDSSTNQTELENLPDELKYLIPPIPPDDGRYWNFGDRYNIADRLPSLEDQGITQIYPSQPRSPTANESDGTQSEWTQDRAVILRKMAESLLLNFLELVGVLAISPSEFSRKIDDLRIIFINAHHLLNEYRPHQARETLILMMEEQLERSRAETAGIMRMKEKVESVLSKLASSLNGLESSGRQQRNPGNKSLEKHGRIWDALDEVLGG
ncbi:MAG: Mediator of RNA polymerase II transcription subunit 7 [Geoglossum umbratile]|nr:MAG: Mediator of RNA polymerase II transcription subunit 7 [Geoglossum umbratile]